MTQGENEDEVKAEVRQSGNTLQVVFDYPGGRRILTIEVLAFNPQPFNPLPKESKLEKFSQMVLWVMAILGAYTVGHFVFTLTH